MVGNNDMLSLCFTFAILCIADIDTQPSLSRLSTVDKTAAKKRTKRLSDRHGRSTSLHETQIALTHSALKRRSWQSQNCDQSFEDKLDKLQKKIDVLVNENAEKFGQLERKIESLESENEALLYKLRSLEERVNATYVGFSAYRSSESNVGAWQRVIYETVTANVGGAYDPVNGRFICPVTGYYYFGVSAFSDGHHNVAEIMVGDQSSGAAFGDSRNWDQGMIATVTLCTQGTEVWIRNARDNCDCNFGQTPDGVISNSFLGFMLSIL